MPSLMRCVRFHCLTMMSIAFLACAVTAQSAELEQIGIISTLDSAKQPALFWAPESAKIEDTPLLVMLHSWSGDYTQDSTAWVDEAEQRGWIFIQPNFRGPNNTPAACGSKFARQDVLDAVEWVIDNYHVDENRVYLAGVSGGGHMTMLMSGRHPERFSAASAWCGISDLRSWHEFHTKDGVPQRYAAMIEASTGGPPGKSAEIDVEYRERSPIFWLERVGDLPLEISTGVDDGHTGSVKVDHSLRAFNEIAKARGLPLVEESEMKELWEARQLKNPRPGDTEPDPTYERDILLRRQAGRSRVTIFQGGHEGLAHAACEWLSKQKRPTKTASVTNTK